MKYIFLLTFIAFNCFAQEEFDDDFAAFESEFSTKKEDNFYDPLEPINRKIFVFNEFVDRKAIEPTVKFYRRFAPKIIKEGIHNFVANLTLPLSTVNSFAQGKTENGLATFSTFLINSTVGVLGFFDIAKNKKIDYEPEDFGQTLGYYGVGSGPYLVLPILGPSNLRDLTGRGAESTVDFMGFNVFRIGGNLDGFISEDIKILVAISTAFDARESLIDTVDNLRKDSFDLYATMRSAYNQNRNSKINK
jgi:phospholipid-binding lipoprotein MlaA